MAILSKDITTGGHWYRSDGTPVHTLQLPDGQGRRPTTIKDARRMNLFPSVTSILNILDKPGLEVWKQNQVALASLRTPKKPRESEEYWCRRVRGAAFDQVGKAADLGSAIHDALERGMNGEAYNTELSVYVESVMKWKESTGIEIAEREIRIVNLDHGFAGTADVFFRYGESGVGILDYKTKKTRPGVEVVAYDNQAMQLASYAATFWGEENIHRVVGANVFISSTEPGRMEVVKHDNLNRSWNAFKNLAALWRHLNDYDPRGRVNRRGGKDVS